MSAFLCSPKQIGVLARWGDLRSLFLDRDLAASEMAHCNIDSIEARYPNAGKMSLKERDAFVAECRRAAATEDLYPYSAVQILKLVHCLEYQSCEVEDWEGSLSYGHCLKLREAAICELPGYSQADWTI